MSVFCLFSSLRKLKENTTLLLETEALMIVYTYWCSSVSLELFCLQLQIQNFLYKYCRKQCYISLIWRIPFSINR